MKRLYYLTKNVESTEQVADDLHRAGITDWHFHVISKDEAGLQKHRIHLAAPWHRFDFVHCGERGALLGAGLGFLIGMFAALTTPVGDLFGLWFVPLPTGLCGFFGAWVGGLVGLSHENYKITRFHDAIDAGEYVLMVDIHPAQEQQVRGMMEQLHPEAAFQGEDSTWISPFAPGVGRSVYEGTDRPGRIDHITTA